MAAHLRLAALAPRDAVELSPENEAAVWTGRPLARRWERTVGHYNAQLLPMVLHVGRPATSSVVPLIKSDTETGTGNRLIDP